MALRQYVSNDSGCFLKTIKLKYYNVRQYNCIDCISLVVVPFHFSCLTHVLFILFQPFTMVLSPSTQGWSYRDCPGSCDGTPQTSSVPRMVCANIFTCSFNRLRYQQILLGPRVGNASIGQEEKRNIYSLQHYQFLIRYLLP